MNKWVDWNFDSFDFIYFAHYFQRTNLKGFWKKIVCCFLKNIVNSNFSIVDDNRADFSIVQFGSFFKLIGCYVWVKIYGQSFHWYRVIWVLSLMILTVDGDFLDNDDMFINNLSIKMVSDVVVINGSWISFLSFDYLYVYYC